MTENTSYNGIYHSKYRKLETVKTRKCLLCLRKFKSRHFGERVCTKCKETVAWSSGDA